MIEEPLVGCSDGCGLRLPAKALEQAAWNYLPISGRWRCPGCRRGLEQANRADAQKIDGGVRDGTNRTTDGTIGQP